MDVAAACGVYPSTVSRWQSRLIPQEHHATVARVLDVSVPYLVGWTDAEEPFEYPEKAA